MRFTKREEGTVVIGEWLLGLITFIFSIKKCYLNIIGKKDLAHRTQLVAFGMYVFVLTSQNELGAFSFLISRNKIEIIRFIETNSPM